MANAEPLYPSNLTAISFKISECQSELTREEQLIVDLDRKKGDIIHDIELANIEERSLNQEQERLDHEIKSFELILRGSVPYFINYSDFTFLERTYHLSLIIYIAIYSEKHGFELLSRCKHSLLSDVKRAEEKRSELRFGQHKALNICLYNLC